MEKDFLQLKREREKFAEENRNLKEGNEKLKDELVEANLLAEDLENERLKLEREFKRLQFFFSLIGSTVNITRERQVQI